MTDFLVDSKKKRECKQVGFNLLMILATRVGRPLVPVNTQEGKHSCPSREKEREREGENEGWMDVQMDG